MHVYKYILSLNVLLWMLNCEEIICFCVCFAFLFCIFVHVLPFFLSLSPCISPLHFLYECYPIVLARFALCCWRIECLFFFCCCSLSRACVCMDVSVSLLPLFVYFIWRCWRGDLGASFIIGSTYTKLDIKIDTTNDQ